MGQTTASLEWFGRAGRPKPRKGRARGACARNNGFSPIRPDLILLHPGVAVLVIENKSTRAKLDLLVSREKRSSPTLFDEVVSAAKAFASASPPTPAKTPTSTPPPLLVSSPAATK